MKKKKVHKKKRYIPIYATGGYTDLINPDVNTSDLYGHMNSPTGKAALAATSQATSSGYQDYDPTRSSYQSTVDTIGGAVSPFYSAGKTVDQALFQKDSETGAYGSDLQAMLSFGVTDPAQNLGQAMTEFEEGDTGRGIASLLVPALAGKYYQEDVKAEEERVRKEQQLNTLRQTRLGEYQAKPMQFKSGGYIPSYPNGGDLFTRSKYDLNLPNYSGPQVPARGPIQPNPVGRFDYKGTDLYNKLDYGQSFKREFGKDPSGNPITIDYRMGYEQPVIVTNERTPRIERDGRVVMPGSETPTFKGGGYLDTTKLDNITYYNGGYTHEQSPINGTPIGDKGKVETKEFRYNDYIFSDRF